MSKAEQPRFAETTFADVYKKAGETLDLFPHRIGRYDWDDFVPLSELSTKDERGLTIESLLVPLEIGKRQCKLLLETNSLNRTLYLSVWYFAPISSSRKADPKAINSSRFKPEGIKFDWSIAEVYTIEQDRLVADRIPEMPAEIAENLKDDNNFVFGLIEKMQEKLAEPPKPQKPS